MLSSIRILVADDHEGWRRQVCLLLQVRPQLQVIHEASDGLEAVRKAEELKPDLILLDIGFPKLNGIEAARRIRQLSPGSKIVFLSLHNSPAMVQEALSTGALGYVCKTDAGSELVPALDAALRGKHFLSSSIKGCEVADTSEEKARRPHEVVFYSDATVLLDSFTRPIAAALKAGNAAIVIATKAHRDSLLRRLKAQGVDTDGALQRGTYISLDAAGALCSIIVDGLPDPVRFFGGLGGAIEAASKAVKSEKPQVVVCGEAVALLQAEGNSEAAIRFEQLGNELGKTHEVDILCAYPFSNFQREEDKDAFHRICAEHSAVYSQ